MDVNKLDAHKIYKTAEEKAQQKTNDIIDDLRKKYPEKSIDQFMSHYGDVYAALTEIYMRGYCDALEVAESVIKNLNTQG